MLIARPVLIGALGLAALAAAAQPVPGAALPLPPQNVIQLAARGQVDVQQDLLTLSLNTTREGADASAVQAQLKQALDSALAEARRSAQPREMELRTGAFSLHPRYGRDGKVNGWQGSTELVLEGRDFARISSTAGRIQSLTIGQVMFGLSREAQTRAEAEAQAMAIERFKHKAEAIARSFGFGGFALREVNVQADDQGPVPRPRPMAFEKSSLAADAPVPVEAGKSTVTVTVSGTVQMK